MDENCFPAWLQRDTLQRIGPQIQDAIPYPVYQIQPGIVDPTNPNTRAISNPTDSFFQSTQGQLLVANDNPRNRIIEICPNNMYDTINVVAFDLSGVVTVPIFLSMNKPGRITVRTTTPPFAETEEVKLLEANTFDPLDASSYPVCAITGQPGSVFYSTMYFTSARSNRPFYIWFGDGIIPNPGTGLGFKISWLTQGR